MALRRLLVVGRPGRALPKVVIGFLSPLIGVAGDRGLGRVD